MLQWIFFLICGSLALEYPPSVRGGDVCICGGMGVDSSQSFCTQALLRNRPYDSTPLSSSFDDINKLTVSGAELVVQSGSTLPRIALEVVSEPEQMAAEGQGDAASLLGVGVFSLLESEVRLDEVAVTGKSSQGVDVDVEFTKVNAHNGVLLADDVQVIARGLAPWDSLTVILNLTVRVSSSVTTSRDPSMWILLPMISIRMIAAIGNATHSTVPLFMRFPFFGSVLHHRQRAGVELFDMDSIALGATLPELTIFVTDIFGSSVYLSKATVRLRAVFSSGTAVVTIRGNLVVPVVYGRAVFKNVSFDTTTPPRVGVYLSFECDDSRVSNLRSPLLTTLPVAIYNYNLGFDNSAQIFSPSSLAYGPTRPWVERAVGAELPTFRVQILDSSGAVDKNSPQGLFVTAVSKQGTLSEWSSRRPVTNGEAVFEGLVFSSIFSSDFVDTVITFTPSDLQNPFATATSARRILRSPIIRIYAKATANVSFLQFEDTSFFSSANIATSHFVVTSGIATPPISLSLKRSDGILLASSDLVTVELVQPRPGLRIGGHEGVRFKTGRAVLCNLSVADQFACSASNFTFCDPIQLRFSVGAASLLSPIFFVIAGEVLSEASIQFEPHAGAVFSTWRKEVYATARVQLPPIVVEILRSDGSVDADANGVVVRAISSKLAIEGATSMSLHGRAIFNNLLFAESGFDSLVFTAYTRNGPVSLRTGLITVEASAIPQYALRFHPESSVSERPFYASAANRVSPVGLQTTGSDGSVINASIVIRAICSVPCVGVLEVETRNGEAWFRNLTFPQQNPNAHSPRISFEAVPTEFSSLFSIGSARITVVSGTSHIFGKPLWTGPLLFVSPSSVIEMRVASYFSQTGLLLRQPAEGVEEVIDTAGSAVSVYRSNQMARQLESTVLSISLQAVNAAQQLVLPTSLVTVKCESHLLLGDNISSFYSADTQGNLTATDSRAIFSEMVFKPDEFVSGFFTSLTFSSPNVLRTLRVGPIHFEGSEPGGVLDEPILLVEVFSGGPSFSIDSWVSSLASIMGVQKDRIEILRVRQGASAASGFQRVWSGTRIELRFSAPTVSSDSRASSTELAENFLSLSVDDCGAVSPLKIRRKLFLKDDTFCDLYVLDEQRRASQRCVEASGPASRCSCHVPMFEALGTRCKSTDQMLSSCATLNRCGEYPAINDPCFELTFYIYLQYFLIGVYTSLFLISVYLVYLWRSGFFSRCRRRTFGDGSDGKAPPMKSDSEIFQFQHLDTLL